MMASERDALAIEAYQLGREGSDGWFRANCPFCPSRIGKDDDDMSFGVQEGSGKFMCFKCEIYGRLRNPPEWFPVDEEYAEHLDRTAAFMEPPEGFVDLGYDAGLWSPRFLAARKYLYRRGYTDLKLWRQAAIGACLTGRYAQRIVVPIRDSIGNWFGWSARDYTGQREPKYLYPSELHRGSTLYEQHLLDEQTSDPVLVVEGVFDALPYFGQVVASLGKPTDAHIELLKKSKRPVAVCLDGDAWREGQSAAFRIRLAGVPAGFVKLPPKQDPGDVDPTWLMEQAYACIE